MNNSSVGNFNSGAAVLGLTSFRLVFVMAFFVLAYIPALATIPKLPWNSPIKWISLNLFTVNSVQILGNMLTLATDIYVVSTKTDSQVLSNVIFSLQVVYITGYLNLVFLLGCVSLWRAYCPNAKHKWIAHLLATALAWSSALAFSSPFVSPSVRVSVGVSCAGHICLSDIPGLEAFQIVGNAMTTFTPTMATYLLYLAFLKLTSSASSSYDEWTMMKFMALFIAFLQVKLAADQIALLVVSSSVSLEAFWAGVFCSELLLVLYVLLSAALTIIYEPYRTKAKELFAVKRCVSKRHQSAVHPLHGHHQQTSQC